MQNYKLSKLEIRKKSCPSARGEPKEVGPGSTPGQSDHSVSMTDHNFAALWPTETHNTTFKRSKPLLLSYTLYGKETSSNFKIGIRGMIFIFGDCICTVSQYKDEFGRIIKVGFSLSNWLHENTAYLVWVWEVMIDIYRHSSNFAVNVLCKRTAKIDPRT